MGFKLSLQTGALKMARALGSFFRKKRKPKSRRLTQKPSHLLNDDSESVEKLPEILEAAIPHKELNWVGPSSLAASQEFSGVQLSFHTKKAYESDLRDFVRFLALQASLKGVREGDLMAQVGPPLIAEYRDYLTRDRNLSKGSVTRKLAVLKSFFKYSVSRSWMRSNPAEFVKGFPQSQDSKTGFLGDIEVLRLLDFLETLGEDRLSHFQFHVLVKTLVFLGIRRSEAQSIRLGHLECVDQKVLLRVQGKGARERRLPISPVLLGLWEKWLKRILSDQHAPLKSFAESPLEWIQFCHRHREQPLFINTKGKSFDAPLSTSEMGHIVRKVGRKAGITFRLSPHMLRATAITSALDAGATHRGVQQMAGWTSPLMISRYDKRLNDPKFSAVFKVSYAGWDNETLGAKTIQQTTPSEKAQVENPPLEKTRAIEESHAH